VGSFAVATTITPCCDPPRRGKLDKVCALALGRVGAVKVFEDHQRGGILGSFFKQTENIGALLF
jgi:hypothetical protein